MHHLESGLRPAPGKDHRDAGVPSPATAHEADLLNIAPGQPLLLLQDVIQNEDGLTFEYSKVAFRGEKIKITLEF